jgi:hypothetical protein
MIITQTITVPANHRLTIDVPPEIPAGRVVVTFAPEKPRLPTLAEQHGRRVFGCAKGQFWMADDFDAPLEEFKDYM